jgi:hypothetical protein
MTTKQAALHTGYGATTSAREVIGDLRPWVMGRDLADRLWTKSEEWTDSR